MPFTLTLSHYDFKKYNILPRSMTKHSFKLKSKHYLEHLPHKPSQPEAVAYLSKPLIIDLQSSQHHQVYNRKQHPTIIRKRLRKGAHIQKHLDFL